MSSPVLEDIRGRFRETSRLRLGEMDLLLRRLEGDPKDAAALQQLARHFHGLAGLGGTCGFPRVSELGDEAEAVLLPLVKRGAAPDAAMIVHFRELAATIGHQIAGNGLTLSAPQTTRLFEVLLVEPDANVAADLAAALEREGMTVRVCNPSDAVAQLEGRVPDVAIVDMAGTDVLERLRDLADGVRVDVIVIGDAAFEDKVRAARDGAEAFLARPLDTVAVVRRVAALRERREHPSRRILVVDDDDVANELFRGILSSSGYLVEVCRNPAEFEKMLFEFRPDLLLMDVQLSHELTGHDLVRFVRQSDQFSTLPVIIVTSDSERRAMLEGTDAGADTMVTKPVDWDLLLSHVAARLERAAVVRELTDRDPLTGVLTRGAFDARVRRRADPARAAFVLIDLDHFKAINDTFGHAAGDRVLASLGTLLRRRLRHSDIVARYGGEEFALLLEGVSAEDAVTLCERLLADFTELERGVTFSAGLAALQESFDETFRLADAALYEAKRSGRARVTSA